MPSSKAANQPEAVVAPIGCQNCRDQHLKCDRLTPTCGRCASTSKECTRGYKFRVKNGPFSKQQRWMRTPKRLRFVDENGTASGDGENNVHVENFQDDWPDSESEETGTAQTNTTFDDSIVRVPQLLPSPIRQRSPTDRFIVHDDHFMSDHIASPTRAFPGFQDLSVSDEVVSGSSVTEETPQIRAIRSQIYRDHEVWPLENREEAMLFRHYVQKLSIWLDVCDPGQSFETVVPPRAGRCKVLLNAILALAAKHLSHTSTFDPYASDRYHQECLSVLIPMLSHDATMSDENLFAATIILRVWEEMEVKHTGMDAHGYLLGIHAFVHGGDRHLTPGSLSGAAFWVGLRQEIYSAVMNQEPVRINLVHSLVDRTLNPTHEYGWSNRACLHCADVLNFCFGEQSGAHGGGRSSAVWWNELNEYNRGWQTSVPPAFTPIFYRAPDRDVGEAFPQVWYHSACHAIGVQHHLLAELFLVSFDPKLPRIGAQRKEAAKRTNERIQELVRKVCGIGLCNQYTPPSMFTACMAIAAFGDRFHDRQDQEACLDILRRTEKDHARPTEAVQQQMMRSFRSDYNPT